MKILFYLIFKTINIILFTGQFSNVAKDNLEFVVLLPQLHDAGIINEAQRGLLTKCRM